MTLSKTRFLSGLQCHKKLWWEVHEPDALELKPDENTIVIFDVGAQVGAAARERVPGGTLIVGKALEGSIKVDRTRDALKAGANAIYEATFEHEGVYASIDILERVGTGFRITKVKSTVEAKEEHLPDLAVQTWVAKGARLPVVESHLMHLNRECRAPDLSNLFARADLSAAVAAELPSIPARVKGMLKMLEGPLPEVAIGDHCNEPRECPFKSRCWPVPVPHDVENLRGLSPKKRTALQEIGAQTIHQIPHDFTLTDFQTIQRRAVQAGGPWIDPTLAAALKAFEGEKVAFFDFETVSPAIPIWDGTGPYAQIPVQFSCHVTVGRPVLSASEGSGDQAVEHYQWIATGSEDPRPGIAQAAVDACRGADVVIAFNAAFEKKCLKGLAASVPALAAELLGIVDRMQDLAEPIRKGLYYHPDFNGRYSLKVVVPALLPADVRDVGPHPPARSYISRMSKYLTHISDTARWVAVHRARETARPDALFHDPWAARLAGVQGKAIDEMMSHRIQRLDWPMTMRTLILDQYVAQAIAQGIDMVIDLAAGLDARPYRLSLPKELVWIDVDLPDITAYKNEVLADATPNCKVERIVADLADAPTRRQLFAELGRRTRKALIITEGLLVYLTADQVEGIAADLHAIPTFQLWALELMSPALLKRLKPTLGKHLAEAGMPFQWGPAEGPAFFNPFGWKELVVRSMFHEAGNHKRLTFPMNLFWYLPEPRPPWSKPWAGVCLFERSRA